MSLKCWWNWWEWHSLRSCCVQDLIMRFDNKLDLYMHSAERSAKDSDEIVISTIHPVLCINYEAPCSQRCLLWREANLGMFCLICFEMFLLWDPWGLSLPQARNSKSTVATALSRQENIRHSWRLIFAGTKRFIDAASRLWVGGKTIQKAGCWLPQR